MDNLVLIRVAATLDASLRGAVVQDFFGESPSRFRLVFSRNGEPRSLALVLGPGAPWVGRPASPAPKARRRAQPFVASCAGRLKGAVLTAVAKPPEDRRVTFRFAAGEALVAELVPGGAHLFLIGADGRIEASARRSRARSLAPGDPYVPREAPASLLDPFSADAATIAGRLAAARTAALHKTVAGIGPVGARLLQEEAKRQGRELVRVLAERLAQLRSGELDPVLDAPAHVMELATRGELKAEDCRLFPWAPPDPPPPGLERQRGADPAETAGLYHDALERAAAVERRSRELYGVLDAELRRIRQAEGRVAADLERFDAPERFRRWGEALLAGIGSFRRADSHALVPDPYDPEAAPLSIPVDPRHTPQQAAQACFERHRRARRGLERAGRRQEQLQAKRARLERLREGRPAPEVLLRALQQEGVPVGIEPPGSARRRVPVPRVRIEGVRIFSTSAGESVLVGKSGRDNHRLTFRLAGPEDFWLHALGVPGAHVILRNDERRSRPNPTSLREAAEAAAWYSEARADGQVEVQWTRRKYVRQKRGAPPGTVILKRFESTRVRPREPGALAGGI